MKEKRNRKLWNRSLSMGLSLAVAASLLPAQPSGAAELSDAASGMPFISKAGSISVSKEHITYDEPFAQWTAGCQYFRIPALITLQDGTLLEIGRASCRERV